MVLDCLLCLLKIKIICILKNIFIMFYFYINIVMFELYVNRNI